MPWTLPEAKALLIAAHVNTLTRSVRLPFMFNFSCNSPDGGHDPLGDEEAFPIYLSFLPNRCSGSGAELMEVKRAVRLLSEGGRVFQAAGEVPRQIP